VKYAEKVIQTTSLFRELLRMNMRISTAAFSYPTKFSNHSHFALSVILWQEISCGPKRLSRKVQG